uniref:Uncharacterized protein MANES_01G245600 n=1 Tax=Rhizophora mucronata TaxID=61149 RepID=A0A2P2IKC8_RHIMU
MKLMQNSLSHPLLLLILKVQTKNSCGFKFFPISGLSAGPVPPTKDPITGLGAGNLPKYGVVPAKI